jgi:hypothetical protein
MATTYCSSRADSAPAPGWKSPMMRLLGMVHCAMPTFLAKPSRSACSMAGYPWNSMGPMADLAEESSPVTL